MSNAYTILQFMSIIIYICASKKLIFFIANYSYKEDYSYKEELEKESVLMRLLKKNG